eukprot:CAMPEP_0113622370 /NCGR_PEP_ID=MMETSP0017_2-20120614/11459_1 /TAXON_ID=2856 /ORGANISM="Cylindrotheca closterium" /LENGTH=306 /DNA_ID=CAMNT_0000532191 /DNA_START=129 /DNA_END=1049 /DNA_ORIENTATION=- /assembly_acc=CAM_ASM_000147
MALRRSPRLRALNSKSVDNQVENQIGSSKNDKPKAKRRRTSSKARVKKIKETASPVANATSLPRKLEFDALKEYRHVLSIDEAGRGPLCGPVVAAAVIYPKGQASLDGIVDSKKVRTEDERERLYESLIAIPNIRWAVCVIDAKRIDEINILQATLEAMRSTAIALTKASDLSVRQVSEVSVNEQGCYVVISNTHRKEGENKPSSNCKDYFALIDGNKIPKDMPCDAECVVKGDGKEFAIAAASIIAKVTRDRLMHSYDEMYPVYGLSRHKGYGTRDHVSALLEHGVSPIHRRTFAPIKHMDLGDE